MGKQFSTKKTWTFDFATSHLQFFNGSCARLVCKLVRKIRIFSGITGDTYALTDFLFLGDSLMF